MQSAAQGAEGLRGGRHRACYITEDAGGVRAACGQRARRAAGTPGAQRNPARAPVSGDDECEPGDCNVSNIRPVASMRPRLHAAAVESHPIRASSLLIVSLTECLCLSVTSWELCVCVCVCVCEFVCIRVMLTLT